MRFVVAEDARHLPSNDDSVCETLFMSVVGEEVGSEVSRRKNVTA